MKKFKIDTLEYFLFGDDPQLLIVSGTHGDEYEVIESCIKAVNKYMAKLPSFIFIPKVSPSAVSSRKRKNEEGVDLNRSFLDETNVKEARVMMDLLEKYRFDTFWTFHEDPSTDEFYMYDSGDYTNEEEYKKFLNDLAFLDVKLLNGIDDPSDLVLGMEFKKGYRPHSITNKLNGMTEHWLLNKKIINRAINPEIPGKASIDIKNKIVDSIFSDLIV